MSADELTRRDVMRAGAVGAGALSLSGLAWSDLVQEALASAPKPGATLGDIEHVVILIQENRSFDHYFGTYKGVRGFGDTKKPSVFTQSGYDAPGFNGVLQPFHVDSNANGACTNDVTHEWGAQHRAWNNGAMDAWVKTHVAAAPDGDGPDKGTLAMGYYERADIPFYHALADAFTLCDAYHCSVIGPTDPNRLYTMSATIDPAGVNGGPDLQTETTQRDTLAGKYTWPTMPESLERKHVSWKVYTSPTLGKFDNVLTYFKNFQAGRLADKGTKPVYPDDFMADIASNKLPQVSWVLPSFLQSEHPPNAPESGEFATAQVLGALIKNKKLWAKTAILFAYDENGGFFDHVPPPVPPANTPGEFLTAATLPPAAEGIKGPIGLGFRVPAMVISPFSRGGLVSSDTFDHTSMLRFLETRFGAKVPNLTKWRRKTTGDMTSAFNFAAKPNTKAPTLPATSLTAGPLSTGNCAPGATVLPYPVPANSMPTQAAGKAKRPSGIVRKRH